MRNGPGEGRVLGFVDDLENFGFGFKRGLGNRQDESCIGRCKVGSHHDQGCRAGQLGAFAGQDRQPQPQPENDRGVPQTAEYRLVSRRCIERAVNRAAFRGAKRRENGLLLQHHAHQRGQCHRKQHQQDCHDPSGSPGGDTIPAQAGKSGHSEGGKREELRREPKLVKPWQHCRQPPVDATIAVTETAVEADRRSAEWVEGPEIR